MLAGCVARSTTRPWKLSLRATGPVALALGLALACGDSSSEDTTSSNGSVDEGIETSAEADASSDGIESDSGTASDDGPRLDAAIDDGSETTSGSESCAKVDLLFVIDNSGSMADEQAKLIANFPGFAAEIQSALVDVDSYHVGVVVTDNFGLPFLDGVNSDAPECRVRGGLVTSNVNGTCAPYAEGSRFMTQADDLDAKFACAANVGDTGSGYEEVAGAMLAAISPALNAPGACNAGFIRDDALLVIVMISDENDDIESMGDPADWYAKVNTFKFNKPDNVVVLSLLWDDSNGNPNNCQLTSDEEHGTAIEAFTNMFTNGSVGSVCVDSYQQFFSDAISVIDSACDEFQPPAD